MEDTCSNFGEASRSLNWFSANKETNEKFNIENLLHLLDILTLFSFEKRFSVVYVVNNIFVFSRDRERFFCEKGWWFAELFEHLILWNR